MIEPSTKDKLPLTLNLDGDLAKRLMAAAEAQKRSAAELAVALLDRHLPRLQSGQTKGKIPYT